MVPVLAKIDGRLLGILAVRRGLCPLHPQSLSKEFPWPMHCQREGPSLHHGDLAPATVHPARGYDFSRPLSSIGRASTLYKQKPRSAEARALTTKSSIQDLSTYSIQCLAPDSQGPGACSKVAEASRAPPALGLGQHFHGCPNTPIIVPPPPRPPQRQSTKTCLFPGFPLLRTVMRELQVFRPAILGCKLDISAHFLANDRR